MGQGKPINSIDIENPNLLLSHPMPINDAKIDYGLYMFFDDDDDDNDNNDDSDVDTNDDDYISMITCPLLMTTMMMITYPSPLVVR